MLKQWLQLISASVTKPVKKIKVYEVTKESFMGIQREQGEQNIRIYATFLNCLI